MRKYNGTILRKLFVTIRVYSSNNVIKNQLNQKRTKNTEL